MYRTPASAKRRVDNRDCRFEFRDRFELGSHDWGVLHGRTIEKAVEPIFRWQDSPGSRPRWMTQETRRQQERIRQGAAVEWQRGEKLSGQTGSECGGVLFDLEYERSVIHVG